MRYISDIPNGLVPAQGIRVLMRKGIVMGAREEHVNAASLDIVLGPKLLVERPAFKHGKPLRYRTVELGRRTPLSMDEVDCTNGYLLKPGHFILAHSVEVFNLPPYITAEYSLKSSMARIGLEHLKAGWCDPGWNGSVLTMELVNVTRFHAILLKAGDRIGQMKFFRHPPVSVLDSYATKGRYNGDDTVRGIKE